MNPLSLMGVLGGCWWFLTGDLKNRVILDIMDHFDWPQGRYPERFMLIYLLKVCQEPPVLDGVSWRMLRVPDRKLRGQGHTWHHESSWLTQRKTSWKFDVDIFIRSVSGIPCLWRGYLEDIEGSWQETWRTESSRTSWITLVKPKEDILKVLCLYLY